MGKLSSFQIRNFDPNTVHVPKISAKLERGTITRNRLYKNFQPDYLMDIKAIMPLYMKSLKIWENKTLGNQTSL